jgi:dUTP pyrophosphatase
VAVTLVYLASPIDQGRFDTAAWVDDSKLSWYRPGEAFRMAEGADLAIIQSINRQAIDHCDAVFAVLPAGWPSLGTPSEVEYAMQKGKPVAIFTDMKWGAQLADWAARGANVSSDPLALIDWLAAEPMPPTRRVEFVKIVGSARLPTRAIGDDAGYDLFVSRSVWIEPGTFVDVHCGVACNLPEGYWGLIIGRSSALRRRGLMVTQGVIDAGYRGELFAGAWNLRDEPVRIEEGERLAQFILLPTYPPGVEAVWADQVTTTERGSRGFGSSGD